MWIFKICLLVTLPICLVNCVPTPKRAAVADPITTPEPWQVLQNEVDPIYWQKNAEDHIASSCKLFPSLKSQKKAKNVILFLGDGMGIPTIAAGRFYIAQRMGLNGSAVKHPFEEWPFSTVARTYDLETMVTDSASSATAYLTGSKTRTGMIGISGILNYRQCGVWPESSYTYSALLAAHETGRSTGIITTTRITHASPAGCYGHVTYRDFEGDSDIKNNCPPESYAVMNCQDLACQLVSNNSFINVAIGGGQARFYPNNTTLPADSNQKGKRLDGRNLVEEWKQKQQQMNHKHKFFGNPREFNDIKPENVDYIFGLPYPDHMPYGNERSSDEPSLMDYTKKAIKVLQKNSKGFFLFVEGGRIDHAHHNNEARHSLDEMLEFDKAIKAAAELVNLEETLILVTADHSHTFELVGAPSRFRNILNFDNGYSEKTLDKYPLTALGYMNGPGAAIDVARPNPTNDDIYSWNYQQQSLAPLRGSSHGGEDVGVYAVGPYSKFFHKTVQNTFIAQAMKYAMGAMKFTSATDPCQ